MNSQKPTLRDVAQRANVAESTASRALAGSGQISATTKERVIRAAQDLGYAITPRSRSMRSSGRKGVIGVVVAALHNSFYPYLVDRLHDELDELGFDMILIIDELSQERANRKIESLIHTSLDGVIVTTSTIGSPTVEFLVENNVPTVLAIRSNERNNVDVIESDNFTAGTEAVRHLIELGHRSIGFLMGPKNTSTSINRFAGAKSVLDRFGLEIAPDMTNWADYTHESGYSGLVQFARLSTRPTAVFCANDVVAVGALEACRKLGIDVPGEMSIIGVDDIPLAGWAMISLTTVRQPIGQIGEQAARLIVDRISGRNTEPPAQYILPTSIIRRETTGPSPSKSG